MTRTYDALTPRRQGGKEINRCRSLACPALEVENGDLSHPMINPTPGYQISHIWGSKKDRIFDFLLQLVLLSLLILATSDIPLDRNRPKEFLLCIRI